MNFTSEKYSKDEEETDPDGDGLGDVHLLPVLILELVEVFSARGPDAGGGHAPGGGAHLESRSQTRRQEDIEDTLEKSQLLAPESFRFTGFRGSVRDLLLLVLLVRLNLSSLSV